MAGTTVNVNSRERLGWAMVVAAFFIFLCAAVAIPLAVNAFLQNTTESLYTAVQSNQGTVSIEGGSGERRAVLVGDDAQALEQGSIIRTGSTAAALLFVAPPTDGELLARLQVYANTTVHLNRAVKPQFELSKGSQEVDLFLENGRLRLILTDLRRRPFRLRVRTPQGEIVLTEAGNYSVETNNDETQVAVREGRATLTAANVRRDLLPNQRAQIPTGGPPSAPLNPERNLIRNGSFSERLDHWTLFAWNVELADQPEGSIRFAQNGGEATLQIIREGIGHADVRLRQVINQDVTDFESLRLQITLRIINQSLPVCGFQGSECPLFVRVNYMDAGDVNRVWQQGFYAVGNISDTAPDACVPCALVQRAHDKQPLNQIRFYDIDVHEILARQGFLPPRFIESVSLVASGHSFAVEVVDVALIAEE